MKIVFKIFSCITLLAFICLINPHITLGADTDKPLLGKKVVLIIPSEDFQDKEFSLPFKALKKEGAEIEIASTTTEEVEGMKKKKVTPTILISEINAIDYDAIIFIGGTGAKEYFYDKRAHSVAQHAADHNIILAAICIAPMILANAGVLETKRATIWNGMAPELAEKCNIYTGRNVEVDGNIITAEGPHSAREFAKKIISKLK